MKRFIKSQWKALHWVLLPILLCLMPVPAAAYTASCTYNCSDLESAFTCVQIPSCMFRDGVCQNDPYFCELQDDQAACEAGGSNTCCAWSASTGQCVYDGPCPATATHTIQTSWIEGPYGSISPECGYVVNGNNSSTFAITPNAGYHLVDVTVDGFSVGAVTSYQFTNVTAYHTIAAVFANDPSHTVTASAGANGSIAPSGAVTVNEGATQAFTVTPNANYHAVMSGTCGGNLVGTTYTTNAVTADCSVVASFALDTHTVTASAGANGSIAPSGAVTVNEGATQAFTVTPAANYHAVMSGTCGGNLVGTTYTTNAVTADCSVVASFALDTHTITASAGANGSIAPSGAVSVSHGGSQSFTITPSSGYHVADVLVDSVSQGAITTYTFTNVLANHTISAFFAIDSNQTTVTLSSGTTLVGNDLESCDDGTMQPLSMHKVKSQANAAPAGYTIVNTYDITCTSYSGTITVTIPYNPSSVPSGKEGTLRMFHWNGSRWVDVTTSANTGTHTITGQVTSLSPFSIGYSTAGSGSGGSSRGTGANENMIAFAILAIFAGIFILRKHRRQIKS